MNKNIIIFLILFFFYGCSFNSGSEFWTKENDIKDIKEHKILKVLGLEGSSGKELNQSIKLNLDSNFKKILNYNSLDNNYGYVNFDGNLKTISRYKFSKIEDFSLFEPEPIFHKKGIIFFDSKGTILNFDFKSKLLWKKNVYSKKEKKLNPILYFTIDKNILIVADSIANYYALNINNGEILWKKKNKSPFGSQIKSYKNNFFLIDYENVIKCISTNDGEEIWSLNTERFLIKSRKRLSNIIFENKLIFINTIGDLTAVDINSGNLLWQTPTQDTSIYGATFKLINSDLVLDGESIYFSNNQNEFFSIDANNGAINWKQKVKSSLRPSIIDNLILTISDNGYLFVLDKELGNIIRITDLFGHYKKKKRKKIIPVGFLVAKKNIYLTTNTGKLILINISSGKTVKTIKIDNERISQPFILNNYLFIAKNNSIIKLN